MNADTAELARSIQDAPLDGRRIPTKLRTDAQVLARVTDGIYRQPSSALRELIANAYDADATSVVIQTDAPRFSEIRIRDDGNGFTVESLASLLHHIGGSPKRSKDGVALGVVREDDPFRSPGGRKLIGKAGIGLFAVSQLTRHFQVITKTKGVGYRIIVDIVLITHSEEKPKARRREEYETGDVEIWRVPATDVDAHGTEIVLMELSPKIREDLQTAAIWTKADLKLNSDEEIPVRMPRYHIGRIDQRNPELLKEESSLPWNANDAPRERFRKLVNAVLDEVGATESNPTLENCLDNYLRLLWTLSLWIPLDYIDGHPFDMPADDKIRYLAHDGKLWATVHGLN